jgi:D-proline reductase (dithiol) PrdB
MSWIERGVRWAFTHIPGVHRIWFHGERGLRGAPPFVPLARPLRESSIGLVTTGGLYHVEQLEFARRDTSPLGDGSYRELDLTRPRESIRIRHDWYDHTDAERDLNLVLPYDRLRELADERVIGAAHPRAISLMGHVEGAEETRLERVTAPGVAAFCERERLDAVLLVPA